MTCRRASNAGPGACKFTCCECGRHIIAIEEDLAPEPPLCGPCVRWPGWLRIAEMRAIIDPEGEVREPEYAALPRWGDPS